MLPLETQCDRCRHLITGTFRCTAFPAGIPIEILAPDVEADRLAADHRQPFPGDQGIRFEARPGQRHPLEVIADQRPVALKGTDYPASRAP
ncbi:MAG TPA: hypothetical protein VGB55_13160 [Tepidisphaeraceae bacterium]|jgi:hypothetical protein